MKKTGIQFMVLLLLVSVIPFPASFAEMMDSDYMEEDVVLFSEVIGGEVELFEGLADEHPLIVISDDSEAVLLRAEKEELSLIRYTDEDDFGKEQVIEGYVASEAVILLSEADDYRSSRMIETEIDSDNEGENLFESESEQVDRDMNESISTKEEDPISNDDGKFSVTSFSTMSSVKESTTSRLGHIRNGNVKIYETIGGKSIVAGSQYTNAVYYIKRQATLGEETYYLISTAPSSVQGVVGWVKAEDLSTHPHVGVDKQAKTFYIKGNGKATTKAWGGSKDTVFADLSKYKEKPFSVHLTEKVGNNTWYRGVLDGKTVWLHSSYVYDSNITKTSRLGHIRNGKVKIYETIGGKSFTAGSEYTNAVYYIKAETKSNGQPYYLISTAPSSDRGVVGWVKAEDLSTHPHVGVDKQAKTFYIKGNGKATTKAWGGSKDTVFADLSKHQNKLFAVHLTEKVGNNIWYRGILDGETVWLHSSYVHVPIENSTSRLGHIRNGDVRIYETIGGKSIVAGSQYTNAVYYIKRQATLGENIYYLISISPSSENGVVGWVKAEDLSTHPHVGVDKQAKTFYIKGNGKATTKAWGGKKDDVYSSLTNFSGQLFSVHLTEKVGENIWYRGTLNGKIVWLHSSYVTSIYTKETDYNLSLNDAVNIQMQQSQMIQKDGKWVPASKEEIRYYMDPNNFVNDSKQRFQHLDLSKPSGAPVVLLDNYLDGKGILNKQGKTFYDAARKYGINEIYLIAHAQLETGNGTSNLATGVKVGRDKANNNLLELVNEDNVNRLTDIKTVYNMFGIGAVDNAPLSGGAKLAYEMGWDTPTKAVDGGAEWISKQYIQNVHKQNTIYKMKWNPRMHEGFAWKQYATDVAWASKQVNTIYFLYQEIGLTDTLSFDIPTYR